MDKQIKSTVMYMRDARSCLEQAALSLQEVKPHNFEPTIKEIKETIGDLSCSIAVLQDFLGASDK
ncbi:hypothetical protein N9L75_03685 [Porticoccaceae bacterium]|nr:hypothetical protein [Porticoccaceae bacterium]MDA8651657.1 hypothetical protein [Porticoccaceae bacterium]MDA8682943.1 hypothetical protein [Porticoccaceae bacterium]MDB2664463.1 hypothetical protein [Porticoccaceae bacterium]